MLPKNLPSRSLAPGTLQSPSTSVIDESINQVPKIDVGIDAGSTRPVDRSLGTHDLPMGTKEWNPSKVVPLAKD